MSEYYSIKQASELMRVPAKTLYRWCMQKKIYGAKKEKGKGWIIPRCTVLELLKGKRASKTVQREVDKSLYNNTELEAAAKEEKSTELEKTIDKPRTIPITTTNKNGNGSKPYRGMHNVEALEWINVEKAIKFHRENEIAEGRYIEKSTIFPQIKGVISLFANNIREYILKNCMENNLDAVATEKAKNGLDEVFRNSLKELQKVVKNDSD